MKILVAYATKCNSTAGVAERIAAVITESHVDGNNGKIDETRQEDPVELQVEVMPVNQVKSVKEYDAVIVGSAVRLARWLPEAVQFVEKNKNDLQHIPIAFFTVCLVILEDTPDHQAQAHDYSKPLAKFVTPVDEAFFTGKLDYSQLSMPTRTMLRIMKKPEGDFRDWHKVEDWAQHLVPKLVEKARTSKANYNI
jgi:menaquinone-dependent protoporphyrinogen oxidase